MTVDAPSGLRRAGVAALRSQGAAFLSQGVGAVLLALLVFHVGAGRTTDVYSVLTTFGQAPVTLWVLGVVYPTRLASGDDDGWGSVLVRTAVSAAGAAGLGALYLVLSGYRVRDAVAVGIPVAVASAAIAAATVQAVRLACDGAPVALSGVSAPGNVLAVLLLVCGWSGGPLTEVVLTGTGLAAGAVVALGLTTRRVGVRRRLADTSPRSQDRRPSSDAAFDRAGRASNRLLLVAATVATAGSLGMQAALARLPSGEATVFGAVTKIGLAVTIVGVNSVLPLLVNWRTFAVRPLRVFCRVVAGLAGPVAAVLVVVAGAVRLPSVLGTGTCACLGGWAVLSAAAGVVTQSVTRSGMTVRLAWSAGVGLPFYTAGAVASVVVGSSLPVAAGMLAGATVVTVFLCASLGWRVEAWAVAAGGAAAGAAGWSLPVAAAVALLAVGACLLRRPPGSAGASGAIIR